VDLELPFVQFEWLGSLLHATSKRPAKQLLFKISVLDALVFLRTSGVLDHGSNNRPLQRHICLDMPLLRTEIYSVASMRRKSSGCDGSETGKEVDIIVKVRPVGRFGDTFLNGSSKPAALKYRIVDSILGPHFRRHYLAPFVIVATGAGFDPVRCLLKWRIATAREALTAGQPLRPWGSSISVFLGLKESGLHSTFDVLNEAMALNLIDMLDGVVSNPEKRRVYDRLPYAAQHIRGKILRRHGVVFVCAQVALLPRLLEVYSRRYLAEM